MVGPCFVMQYRVSFLVFNPLAEEERAGCFTLLWCFCGVIVSVLCLFLVVLWVDLWYWCMCKFLVILWSHFLFVTN